MKKFDEIFHELHTDPEVTACFSDTQIEKITTNSAKDILRVYLVSPHLIAKQDVFAMEEAISKAMFCGRMKVRICERFRLSAQYDLKNLTDAYKDSILCELKRYSMLLYNLLRKADWEITDDTLQLTLGDTMFARQKHDELLRILYKIYHDRCGQNIVIRIGYKQQDASEASRRADERMQSEIDAIRARDQAVWNTAEDAPENAAAQKAENKEKKETAPAKKAGQKTASNTSQKSGKKSGRRTSDGERRYERSSRRRSDDPDVIYGRGFDEDAIPMSSILDPMGEVVVRGQIIDLEYRPIRNEKTIVMFSLTDFTDTFRLKIFIKDEQLDELKSQLKNGGFYKVKGVTAIDRFDSELSITSITGIKKIPDFRTVREDLEPVKRVELHCHTKMSDMDGVSDVADILARAAKWGHKAIAITDHGNVQAFPEAAHALPKDHPDFKVIYGIEAYIVDDLKGLVTNPAGQTFDDVFVVFDLETTGLSAEACRIIEIGAVKIEGGKITDRFSTFVNPKVPIPYRITQLTSISDDMVIDAPAIEEIFPKFMEFCEGAVMVAHNAEFDMSFLYQIAGRMQIPCEKTVLDTVSLARFLLPQLNRYKLDTVAKALGIPPFHHHRAVDDAAATAEIFLKMIDLIRERGADDLNALAQLQASDENTIRKLPAYHCILLAANDIGRVNLYKLVSDSHLKYFNRYPKMPKSEILKYREGLLIGSACEAGELYNALTGGRSAQEIARIVEFYDYLEIQPTGNNAFMIASDKYEIYSVEDIQKVNRRIVDLGRAFRKPVCATCDVHFLDPEDEVYRRIIMAGKGFPDADDQAPLYLRTTEEMLAEFAYLGDDLAREVVITNTNKIADMCEVISPVRPDKCPPVIENSDVMLREMCYARAHEIYGPDLPQIVTDRLERELNSIISNGFAVMYIIAEKLVKKSNEDGYLVGSRGSVGSSFVATMAGITEVNPLSPHYLCGSCYYVDFDSPQVRKYAGAAGCDMPDQVCPVCGKPLQKLGFDIPFETFLGFKGNKEPDIDLNFSGEYQPRAHRYTEVIFGTGQTFRAGTIGTLADKTAYGYVKNYYEERGQIKRSCEINRIVQGCVGVRRTTGQHPGGIIVLPIGENIYSFTPIQHPANDMTTDIITTHFDYHSIDHNLLKLDILGHDDPTMIRMLQDLTGIDPIGIPLDNKEVMSLFQNTKALGIEPDDILGCPLGALGIPEFGTDFAMQMLLDTKPQAFSDLVRIAGLSHGTDVWLGNAQKLIAEGTATISTAICTRDDIMTYLIEKGLDKELSFTIMEKVRKGKGLTPEWEEEMRAHDVPDWYIWSCNKIKYMFPKAHAVAYVMMAWRIAWFKVFEPLAYYAAFFSIRATAFNYEIMCRGEDRLMTYIDDYRRRKDTLSKKEQDTWRDMRIVQEMYARGFEFLPIDLYKAKASRFQIIDGKLMPSFSTIDGMGEKAAESLEEAAAKGPFLSKDDLRDRAKLSKNVIDAMEQLGLLKGLPESNQMSLFDLIV